MAIRGTDAKRMWYWVNAARLRRSLQALDYLGVLLDELAASDSLL